jgi:hypothetical protein
MSFDRCFDTVRTFAKFLERHITGVHISPEEMQQLTLLGAREGLGLADELRDFAGAEGFGFLACLVLSRID